MSEPLVSVVIPVHDEEAGLPELRRRLDAALGALADPYEIVFVDDGSGDGSAALIAAWVEEDAAVTLVQLSRNFGMEIAMTAGLEHARGRYAAITVSASTTPRKCCERGVASSSPLIDRRLRPTTTEPLISSVCSPWPQKRRSCQVSG